MSTHIQTFHQRLILFSESLHRDKKSSSLDANIKGYILEKYDEKLGSSATEDSSIVTTSIISSFRKNNEF